MNLDRHYPSFQFGSSLTPIGKRLILLYGAIYIIELILTFWIPTPLVGMLQLYPLSSPFFRFWQILTHPFLHYPDSQVGFLINCIMLYFFVAPIEYVMGTRRFLILFYTAAVGAAFTGMVFSLIPGFDAPFMGMLPSLLCLVVVFGLLNPEATILLMFILPIKAKYISYATVLITILTLLAKANPYGGYHLGGILFGYLYFRSGRLRQEFHFFRLRRLESKSRQRREKFKVIKGEKRKDDKPTYH